jgi:hypothetical protein
MHRITELFVPVVRAAEDWQDTYHVTGDTGTGDVATIGSLVSVFKNIVGAVVVFVGVVLFVMLVIGGFNFLFSGGDPKQVQKAQGTISAAIIGLVVVVSAYVILNLVFKFTGVDVTKFSIQTN